MAITPFPPLLQGRPLGLSRKLRPLRGKAKPFLIIRTESLFGHAETSVGLLAVMGRQRPKADWRGGCHEAEPYVPALQSSRVGNVGASAIFVFGSFRTEAIGPGLASFTKFAL